MQLTELIKIADCVKSELHDFDAGNKEMCQGLENNLRSPLEDARTHTHTHTHTKAHPSGSNFLLSDGN